MIIGLSGKRQHGKDLVAAIIQYLTFKSYRPSSTIGFEAFVGGADTFGTIEKVSGWTIKKFAGKLKSFVSSVLNIPVEDLENDDVKNNLLPEEWRRFFFRAGKRSDRKVFVAEGAECVEENELITVRKFLQEVGTEACRNHIHLNFWLNALMSEYKPIGEPPFITRTASCIRGADGLFYVPNDNLRIPKEYWDIQCSSDTIQWQEPITQAIYPDWIITDVRFPNEAEVVDKYCGYMIRINRPSVKTNDDHPSETSLDNYPFRYVINNTGNINDLINIVKELLIELNLIRQ